MRRLDYKFDSFKKAFWKLQEVCDMDYKESDILRDSIIQRFEFTYELAWKTLKEYRLHNGMDCENYPRAVLKAAFA